MSKTIDQKVVQMQFDNQSFEQGAKQTMSTLDKLKAALKFDGANKGADELGKSIKNAGNDFSQCEIMATKAGFHIQDVWLKLSNVLEYRIARKIISIGESMAKSLTLDQVTAGFSEYELKMGSIQTIMAGTGEKLEVVNKYLNELNEYSDRTIYSFSDMTQNIGKFTNAGVKLKDAVSAIQGVANVAAVSGANANEASRAMYNFAQALSAGYVKLIDWKSIENANMATVEFKDTLLQTAAAMGYAKESGDGYYKILTTNAQGKTMDSAISATKNFNDSLAYQWMKTDVLTQALEIYSKDVTTMTEAEKEAYETKLKSAGFTDEQIKKFEELGTKASAAATEVKTFSQLMDTIKESIGSGWAMSFEHIIGNFEEAKELFTEVSSMADSIISKISDRRNTLLNNWKMRGGRAELIQSFRNIAEAIGQIIKVAKQLWYDLFPPTTSKDLYQATKRFELFTRSLIMNEDTVKDLREALHYLLTPLKVVIELVKVAFKLIVPIYNILVPIVKIIMSLSTALMKTVVIIGTAIYQSSTFQALLTGIKNVIKTVISSVKNLATSIGGAFVRSLRDSDGYLHKFVQLLGFLAKISLSAITAALNSIANFKFSMVTDGIAKMKDRLNEFITNLKGMAQNSKVIQVIVAAIDKLKSGFEFLKEAFLAFSTTFSEGLENVHSFTDFLGLLKDSFANAFKPIVDFFKSKIFGESGNIFDNLKNSFKEFVDTITEGAKKIPWSKVILVAFCIGLAAAVLQLVNAISKFSMLASAVAESIRIVNETVKRFTSIRNRLIELKEIAIFIAAIALSLGIIASFPKDDILRATAILASLAGGLMILAEAMMFINTKAMLKPAAMSQLFVSLAGLAVGTIALTAAVIALSDLKKTISELLPYIAELGLIMGELIASMAILGLLGKKLSLSMGAFSALSLISFASSIYLLCRALKELDDVEFSDLEGLTKMLIAVLGGFAVISALSKRLGFWSFASLIAIMIGLKNFAPLIKDLSQITISDDAKRILELVTQIITVVSAISMITTIWSSIVKILKPKQKILKQSSSLLGDFSRTILAIGISMSIMTLAITNIIKTIDKLENVERVKMALIAAGLIIAALGVFIVKVSQGGKIFTTHKGSMLKFAAGVALLSLTIVPLVLCVEEIAKFGNKYKEAPIVKAGIIVSALIGVLGIFSALASKAAGVNFKTLLTIFGGLTLIIGEIVGLSLLIEVKGMTNLKEALGVLVDVILILEIAILGLSKIDFNSIKSGPVIAFTTALGLLLGGMITAAALLSDDSVERLKKIVLGFLGVTATITLSLIGISKYAKAVSWPVLLAFVAYLGAYIGAFIVLCDTVERADWDGLKKAFWGFVGLVAVMVGAAELLDGLETLGSVGVILALSGSIVALAGALKLLDGVDLNKVQELLLDLTIVEAIFVGLGSILGALDYLFGVGAAIQAAILVLAALNASLALLAGGIALVVYSFSSFSEAVNSHLVPALLTIGENAETILTAFETIGKGIEIIGESIAVSIAKNIVAIAQTVSAGVLEIAKSVGQGIVLISSSISVGILDIAKSIASGIQTIIIGTAKGLVDGIDYIVSEVSNRIRSKFSIFNKDGADSASQLKSGFESTSSLLPSVANTIINKLLSTLGSFGGSFFSIGASLFGSLLSGFGSNSDSRVVTETVENAVYGSNGGGLSGKEQTLSKKTTNTANTKNKGGGWAAETAKIQSTAKAADRYFIETPKKFEKLNITVEHENKSITNVLKDLWSNTLGGISKDSTIFGYRLGDAFDTIKSAGGSAFEAIKGWFDPSTWMGDALNFEDMMKDMTAGMEDITSAAAGAGDGLEGMGEKAKKGAKGVKEAADEVSSFVEKMEGSFNILEEFKLDEGDEENPLTGDKLLSNMRSNIDGMVKWSHEMKNLSGKVAQGLYQKLADLGPQGYKYVHAFAQMTEEQLAEVNQMYATSLVIPTSVAAEIYQGMNLAAGNAYTGFVNGMKIEEFQQLGIELATGFLTGLSGPAGMDSHSPSKKTYDQGMYAVQGLDNGLKNSSSREALYNTVSTMCTQIITKFRLGLSATSFKDIGQQVLRGLDNGIRSKNPDVLSAISELSVSVIDKAKSIFRIASPSKEFAEIGDYLGLGLASGIKDSTPSAVDAANTMADETTTALDKALSDPKLHEGVGLATQVANMLTHSFTIPSSVIDAVRAKYQEAIKQIEESNKISHDAELREAYERRRRYQEAVAEMEAQAIKEAAWNNKMQEAQATSSAKISKDLGIALLNSGNASGISLVRGIVQGIQDYKVNQELNSALNAFANGVIGKTNSNFGIQSPSKVFAKMGEYLDLGLAKGITDNATVVNESVNSLSQKTVDSMRDAVSTIQSAINSDLDVEPVIRPVVDLSNIQNGVGEINSLMGPNFNSVPQASFMQSSELINNTDNTSVVDAVVALQSDVVSLKDAMTNIKMVLDTGTMVGAMTPAIDQELGMRTVYAGRSM